MEELMKTKIFKVTVERLLLNGGQTLYMVGWSLLIGTIIGMILALILVLCRKGGLVENRPLYMIVSVYINVVRSIPFVILLVTIMPITRAIVGTTIGSTAALVPLVVYISPYLARLMENSRLRSIREPGGGRGHGRDNMAGHPIFPGSRDIRFHGACTDNGNHRTSWSVCNGRICRWRRSRRSGIDIRL